MRLTPYCALRGFRLDDGQHLAHADHGAQGVLDELGRARGNAAEPQVDAELAAVARTRGRRARRDGTAPSLATGSIRRGSRPGSAGAVT